MKLLFELSGEHPDLPRTELHSVLESEGISYKIVYERDRVIVIDAETKNSGFVSRLAMTLKAGMFPVISNNVLGAASLLSEAIPKLRTLVVRSKSHTLEEELGEKFYERGYVIDLDEADVKVIAYRASGGGCIAAINIPMKRDYNKRRPQHRPYFHPTSMHPKLARTLVNLSRAKKGSTVIDPFCGTGGILIEAGLMGMNLRGSDIDSRMVAGCKKNLESYSLFGEITKANALDISSQYTGLDAIVTDPPYARCSYVSEGRADLGGFYETFLTSARKALKPEGILVMMIPRQYQVRFTGYDLLSEHYIRVHKSLTRRIVVLQKLA